MSSACDPISRVAVVDDKEAVCVFERGEAMGNGKGRASLHESVNGFLDLRFCLGIHAGGGFVENENAWVSQDRACNGDALSFAPERRTPRSPTGVS